MVNKRPDLHPCRTTPAETGSETQLKERQRLLASSLVTTSSTLYFVNILRGDDSLWSASAYASDVDGDG